METKHVQVALGMRSYDILIGERLLNQAGKLLESILPSKRAIIVCDENVARFYLHRLCNALEETGMRFATVIVPPGEQSKSFARLEAVLETMLERQPDRKTTIIALGGGVVGDLAGFAASVLLRGVPFVQIPTTLLAQVDSSVGGKTGINAGAGKNLVGAFWQPKRVLIDLSTLTSLPERHMKAGFAEVIKYGLIDRPDFFVWLEANTEAVLARETNALAEAVRVSCESKAAIVSSDETEQGARALLNLGHTFGHVLESETGFSDRLYHGEAVAVGMRMAFDFSVFLGLCPKADAERARALLTRAGLPVDASAYVAPGSAGRLIDGMLRDKKATDGTLTFILARGIGQTFVAKNVEQEPLKAFLEVECGK